MIYIAHVSSVMKRNWKEKLKKKKKRWEDREEFLLHVSYYDSLESNFHVLKVSLPGYLEFWISLGK